MKFKNRTSITLTECVANRVTDAIESGRLAPGSRLPSIRNQAQESGVSTFTVVEAYDRLVAQGRIESHRGSGFFVKARPPVPYRPQSTLADLPIDEHWLLRNVYNQPDTHLPAGCGWLPANWYDVDAQHRALRAIARGASLSAEYGDPQGYLPLRRLLARHLAERDILSAPSDIILTQGASSALNIAAATVAHPGDTLFVDDPGYCNLLSSLTSQGFNIVGVPWTGNGPDTARLEQLLLAHRPRAFFTNPWLQNPTGASYSISTAHQVLKLAERYDFQVVEDNVSADLAGMHQPTLAALDGLNRVIYISSFSKSLSPGLRVGFIAARSDGIEKMVHYKMMSGLTTPELGEKITLEMLQESRYRKQLDKLRSRLSEAQYITAQRFDQLGWEMFTRPQCGLFLLAKPPGEKDSLALAREALAQGILLAPGKLFRPYGAQAPWLRFNVAYCQHETLWSFLDTFST